MYWADWIWRHVGVIFLEMGCDCRVRIFLFICLCVGLRGHG